MRVWVEAPSCLAIFRTFFEKKAVLTPLNHISHVFGAPFESTRFLTSESQLKKVAFQSFFCLQFKSKTRLKSYIWELNFVSDLVQVGAVKYIASCNILAVNNNPLENFP